MPQTINNSQKITPLPPHIIQQALEPAFREDWGLCGDITSAACVPPEAQIRAQLRVRPSRRVRADSKIPEIHGEITEEHFVIAGLELAKAAFCYGHQYGHSDVQVTLCEKDGVSVVNETEGSVLAELSGSAAQILARERVALNYLCHLSGIATLTRRYVEAAAHTSARIVDTRKTTPGLRALEKFAVRCGGGANHRFGLFDAIMIKDNHIATAGGIVPAMQAARAKCGHLVGLELEIDTLEQLYQLDLDTLRPDCLLLDNMSPQKLQAAVQYVAGRTLCEASGGVGLSNVAEIAETGVDLISVGALTHSAPILDIGLDFLP